MPNLKKHEEAGDGTEQLGRAKEPHAACTGRVRGKVKCHDSSAKALQGIIFPEQGEAKGPNLGLPVERIE